MGRLFRPELETLEARDLPVWTAISTLPSAASGTAAPLPDGRILFLGLPSSGSGGLGAAIYSPTNNNWTTAPSLPVNGTGFALATGSDGRVYAAGGAQTTAGSTTLTPIRSVFAYDPKNNVWAQVADLPTARFGVGATPGPDGRIYVIGGFTDGNYTTTNIVEVYTPAQNAWQRVTGMITARGDLGVTLDASGMIYAVGGSTTNATRVTNATEIYNPQTDVWTAGAAMITPRTNLGVSFGPGGLVYAMGGDTSTTNAVTTVETYTPGSNAWVVGTPMITGRDNFGATVGGDGRLYAIGGGTASTTGGGGRGGTGTTTAILGSTTLTNRAEAFTNTVAPPTPSVTAPNEHYVAALYEVLLGRQVDPVGLAYWTGLLDKGVTRLTVVMQIENTQEFRIQTIREIYVTYLNRQPDQAGLAFWLGFVNSGAILEQVQVGILASEEYFQTQGGGTNAGYVNALYMDLLFRPVDQPSGTAWILALQQGQARAAVAGMILTSQEADAHKVVNYYSRYLGRTPDAYGFDVFTTALVHGTLPQDVIAVILSSQEFFTRAQTLPI